MKRQSDRYKENLANFKKQYSDLVNRSRTTLNTNTAEIKVLTAERDSLKVQLESKALPAEQSSALSTRIEVLVAEKAQLETSFSAEKTRLESIIESERAKAAAAAATVVSNTGFKEKPLCLRSLCCSIGHFITANGQFHSPKSTGWKS